MYIQVPADVALESRPLSFLAPGGNGPRTEVHSTWIPAHLDPLGLLGPIGRIWVHLGPLVI